jgi:hypothetical protein
MRQGARDLLTRDTGVSLSPVNPRFGLFGVTSPLDARTVGQWITTRLAEIEAGTLDAARYPRLDQELDSWIGNATLDAVIDVFQSASGTRVASIIGEVRDFHDPGSAGNLPDLVWRDMVDGRLVIVDLSVGNERVTKILSERLVTGLLSYANQRFRSQQEAVPIQIVVEEAHNLFDRDKAGKSTTQNDPWVRLSKEAAKYEIGLVYATQEVSSVDKRILSNTSNWIIAHLNSDNETRELGHYYDFGAFADDIRRAEDRGFVRMKTFSSPYIVPVQVDKFDHAMINRARAAANLPPVSDSGEVIRSNPVAGV